MISNSIKEINQMAEGKKVFIFDFDGTIVNTENYYWIALGNILKSEIGGRITQEHINQYLGGTREHIKSGIMSNHKVGECMAERIMVLGDREFDKVSKDKVRSFQYFKKVSELHKDKKFVILTSSDRVRVENLLNKVNLNGRFNDLISVRSDKIPKIDALSNTEKFFGFKQNKAILFEDNEEVLGIARRNGINSVGVEHKFNRGRIRSQDIKVQGLV